MKRTFKGFLKAYCAELSGLQTTSLRKLVQAANGDAPRAAEPIFCLALEERKLSYLLTLSRDTWMGPEWERLAGDARRYETCLAWLSQSAEVPERYAKVMRAYQGQWDALRANRRMNEIMRKRTLRALENAHVTKYRLVKDLGVNKGNLYAYLDGDDSKVGKNTARRIMEYAESFQ